MLIKSNKGSSCIPPLINKILDENFNDREKCDLLNKYFTLLSALDEQNVEICDNERKTDKIINDIYISKDEIIEIIKILEPNKAS